MVAKETMLRFWSLARIAVMRMVPDLDPARMSEPETVPTGGAESVKSAGAAEATPPCTMIGVGEERLRP